MDQTRLLLEGCGCDASCYDCLRNYSNQYYHGLLNRKLALVLLEHIVSGGLPCFEKSELERLTLPIRALLDLRGLSYKQGATLEFAPDVEAPLVVHTRDGVRIWLDVHHPFVPASMESSPVLQAAQAMMEVSICVDSYDVEHDLPKVNGMIELLGA